MKRKNTQAPEKENKKQRTYLKEADSVYDQAEPYRLAIARFPIDALTPEWSLGSNRPINKKHTYRLCQIFQDVGVLRRDTAHRLRIACTKAQVQQMFDHLSQGSQTRVEGVNKEGVNKATQDKDAELSFQDWASVVGEKAELMAGNHRVEALKEYLQLAGSGDTERWWMCDIYDKDTLPPDLRVKLRANRQDSVLPDNHGQIWTELATLASSTPQLFQGSNKTVEAEMLEHLGLSSRVKFPVRRLVTLWKNKSWSSFITRWCQYPLGEATFSISLFEWIASGRIDNFWFAAFDQALVLLAHIRKHYHLDLHLSNWNQLAALPQPRTAQDVQALFYPTLDTSTNPRPSSPRSPSLLLNESDEAYYNFFEFVTKEPKQYFVDIQALLKTTNKQGKVMSTVMAHVAQWMNCNPAKVVERDNNKPMLRVDLVPGLQDKYGRRAEEKSKVLEEKVLQHVRDHMQEFTAPTVEPFLHEYPEDTSTYPRRFEHAVWATLLSITLDFAGPNL